MKTSPFTLIGTTVMACLSLSFPSGCSKAPEPESLHSKVEWSAPRHTDLEVYLNQYKVSATQGATARPDLMFWKANAKWTITSGPSAEGRSPYSAKLEYKGTSPAGDHYAVTITHPVEGGVGSSTQEVVYQGNETELFRDDEYRIGLRPHRETGA